MVGGLGEINDSRREQWIRAIEVFDEEAGAMVQLVLEQRPEDRGSTPPPLTNL